MNIYDIPVLLDEYHRAHPTARGMPIESYALSINGSGCGGSILALICFADMGKTPEAAIERSLHFESDELMHVFDTLDEALAILRGEQEPEWKFEDEV